MNIFKELRKQKGLTQIELAKVLNVQQTTVSKWEVGRAFPDYPILVKLSEFYGVTTDYLMGREDKKDIIERPSFDLSDKQLVDLMKLYKVMTEIQKAHVLGYIIAYLEREGVNVKTVLGY